MRLFSLRHWPLLGGIAVAAGVALAASFWLQPHDAVAAAANQSGAEVWGADYFPNVKLTDQDGKQVRFYDDLVKGKIVAINTFFTSCSASCGLETARMREVQQLLGDRVGKDVFFYSITIDPLTDGPAEMKAYAKRFNVGPGWRFLTGSVKDTELLRRKLGLFDDKDAANPNKNDHMLHSVIGNQATGRWMRSSPFENPLVTATQIGTWLNNYKLPPSKDTAYALAPQLLRNISDGEKLFRTRCASCHSVNANDKSMAAMQKVGPDLQGVGQRRPRAWLERWLKEPDVMLTEKDPTAIAIFNQYNKLAMPNLRLDHKQIAQLLEFIDEESALPAGEKRIKQ
jgi:protein SCO1